MSDDVATEAGRDGQLFVLGRDGQLFALGAVLRVDDAGAFAEMPWLPPLAAGTLFRANMRYVWDWFTNRGQVEEYAAKRYPGATLLRIEWYQVWLG